MRRRKAVEEHKRDGLGQVGNRRFGQTSIGGVERRMCMIVRRIDDVNHPLIL